MNKIEFKNRLDKATEQSVEAAKDLIEKKFLDKYIFSLIEMQSDGDHDGKFLGEFTNSDSILEFLYKDSDGSVPRWINIQVDGIKDGSIIIKCVFSNIFLKEEQNLLHTEFGLAPFHVLMPRNL